MLMDTARQRLGRRALTFGFLMVAMIFKNQEVGNARRQMNAHGGGEQAKRVMGRNRWVCLSIKLSACSAVSSGVLP